MRKAAEAIRYLAGEHARGKVVFTVAQEEVPDPRHPAIVIPGQELAGEVEAIGRKVTRFRKGDQIVAWTGLRLGT